MKLEASTSQRLLVRGTYYNKMKIVQQLGGKEYTESNRFTHLVFPV